MSKLIQKVKWNLDGLNTEIYMYGEADFYDNESSEETLRYCVEQNLEDVGFNVIDVSVMK
ncbi:MAG: hypothetical protein ACLUQX_15705 [Thomasclavelia spiroformis]